MHRISKYVSITFKPIKYGVSKPIAMIIQPMMQGISLSATVVFVTAISNGLSTYLLSGATLESKIEGRLN